jgi:hypothetical protein
VKVIGGVLLIGVVGLVRPVHTDFLQEMRCQMGSRV